MQIERAVANITTLGPNNRFVFFVNGCNFGCVGCVSARLQIPNSDNERDVVKFFSSFDLHNIDGVTVSGGEPFDQSSELRKCIDFFLSKGIDDILVYTGYTLKELLQKKDRDIVYILSRIAVLVDGRYVQELNDNKSNMRGSTNQNIIVINAQYANLYKQYEVDDRSVQELYIGNMKLAIGIPTKEYIENF